MVKEFRTLEISVLMLWFPLVVKCENGRLGSASYFQTEWAAPSQDALLRLQCAQPLEGMHPRHRVPTLEGEGSADTLWLGSYTLQAKQIPVWKRRKEEQEAKRIPVGSEATV